MPRILRIINRLNLGGPTFNAAYLSKYLAPEFDTMLVAGMIDETEASSEFITRDMGLHPVYIPEMYREIHPLKDFRAYQKLKKIILDFKPDIVHTHAAKAGTLGRLAASACKVPVIVHTFHGHVFHSYFPKWKTDFFIRTERYVAKKSSAIITVSERLKTEIGNVYKICPLEKIEVVPLGFDLRKFSLQIPEKRKKFRSFYQVDEDEVVIVIVGRLVPIKNHKLFLNVLKSVLNQTGRKIRAFIVGDGEERKQLEALALSLHLDFVSYPDEHRRATLTFTSWIKEIDEVYAGADIVALTSLNEGTPVSLIEAQAAGKPIVTTNVGGIEDIVIADQTALIASPHDQDEFSNKLLRLVNDDLLRQKMSTGAQTVVERFDYRRLVKDMSNLYSRLLPKVGS